QTAATPRVTPQQAVDPRLQQAADLERQSSAPYPKPQTLAQKIGAGVLAGAEGFASGYTGNPRFMEAEQQRQQTFQALQQNRLIGRNNSERNNGPTRRRLRRVSYSHISFRKRRIPLQLSRGRRLRRS